MKYEIEINGAQRNVEYTPALNNQSHFSVVIDGRSITSDVAIIAPGVYSVLLEGRSFEITVEEAVGKLLVRTGGREFVLEIADPRSWRRKHGASIDLAGRQQVIAPMPGKIVRLLVAPGQRVESGQGLLVVEAMKMQNEIRSPKSGTVEKMVREGQTVSAGEILAVVG